MLVRLDDRSFVDGGLLARGQVLESELPMAAEQEGKEPQQVEHESDHQAEIVTGCEPTDQPLGRRMEFGEGHQPNSGSVRRAQSATHQTRCGKLQNEVVVAHGSIRSLEKDHESGRATIVPLEVALSVVQARQLALPEVVEVPSELPPVRIHPVDPAASEGGP